MSSRERESEQDLPAFGRSVASFRVAILPVASLPVAGRIERRLRRQHARWLLHQPVYHSYWFQLRRRLRKRMCVASRLATWFGNWCLAGWPGYTVLFVLLVMLGAFAFRLASSWLANLGRLPAASDLANAMAFFTLLSTFGTLGLLGFTPGADREATVTKRQPNRPQTPLRVVDRRQQGFLAGFRTLVRSFTVVAILTLTGLFLRTPCFGLAVAASTLTIGVSGWCVWRVGLTCLRTRWRPWGIATLPEYLGVAALLMAYLSILTMFPESSGDWGGRFEGAGFDLKWFGPLGWLVATLDELAHGDTTRLLPIAGYLAGTLLFGWIVARGAADWSQRRKLIESQRRSLQATLSGTAGQKSKPTRAELEGRIRDSISRYDHRTKSIPSQVKSNFRRLPDSVYAVAGILLVFQLNILGIQATVLGGSDGELDALFSMLLTVPIVIGWFGLELLTLSLQFLARTPFQMRPVTGWRHWWELQWQGLVRLPSHLICLLPFVLVWWSSGQDSWQHLFLTGASLIGMTIYLRTGFALASLVHALQVSPWIVSFGTRCCQFICLLALMYCVGSQSAISTGDLAWTAHGGIIFAANAVAIMSFFAVNRCR